MKNLSLFLLLIITLYSCNSNSDNDIPEQTQEQEQEVLNAQLQEIQQLVDVPCTDANDWDLIAVGSKPCGGPQLYIAYPTTIDTESFLTKVEAYTTAENDYNIKWSIASNCEFVLRPDEIACEDGKPIFIRTR